MQALAAGSRLFYNDLILIVNGWSLELKILELLPKCNFTQLKSIHALLTTTSLHRNVTVFSTFLRRSTEFGTMEYSDLVFSHLCPDFRSEIVFWNAMIRGYAFNGQPQQCVSLYGELLQRGLKPHNFTYPFVLNSCADLDWFWGGKKVHSRILKTGFSSNFAVSDAMLNLYLKMSVSDARKVFDEMCVKGVEVWNRMISAYASTGDVEHARLLFDNMYNRDIITWNAMISGYIKARNVVQARDLFERMPENNVVSWTLMIRAYAEVGDLSTARKFFHKMPHRNVVSWNSMIYSCVQHGNFQEALDLFVQMQSECFSPDGYTFVAVLSACSHLGSLEFGKWIHYLIGNSSQLGVIAATALIEMYAKCGDIDRAFSLFIKTRLNEVFYWNVMIKSLAVHGRAREAIKLFLLMQKEGLKANDLTFLGVLFACSHGGMVEEGQTIFHDMEKKHGISPKIEHFGCVVDLLCRNGQLEDAVWLVNKMPFEPDVAIWGALLSGCKFRSDFKTAGEIVERVRKQKTNEAGIHVALSNMYASAEHWQEAQMARQKMEEESIWKTTGHSRGEVEGDECPLPCFL